MIATPQISGRALRGGVQYDGRERIEAMEVTRYAYVTGLAGLRS